MRILMYGHWSHTGFGIVTMELSKRFLELGHDVRVLAQNHRGEPIQGPMAGRVWAAGLKGDTSGANLSVEAATGELFQGYDPTDTWLPDVCLFVADAGTMWMWLGQQRESWPDRFGPFGTTIPSYVYVPIEGDNLNVSWRDLWARVKPIAMSNYGAEQISAHIGREVPMIYHGVDTDNFFPVSRINPIQIGNMTMKSKEEAKIGAGFDPNRTLLLRVDRLVERKQFHVLLASLVPVFASHPEVDLVLHTHPLQPPLNLYEEVARIPAEFIPRIKVTGAHDTYQGLPTEALNALYNAADIYVSPTAGEGFGLTLGEALACEVPVVTTDYAAGPEVMAPGGIAAAPLHDTYGNIVRIHSVYGMDWCQPDPVTTTAAIMRLLEKPSLRRELGRLGRMHVQKMFNWNNAAKDFIDVFTVGVAEFAKPEM